MPRKEERLTDVQRKRNYWLTKTSLMALRKLKYLYPDDYRKILNQIRKEYPE